jgi:toxin ParE1/3/4
MAYKIHPKARQRLAKIWADTAKEWGEAQADHYIDTLYQAMHDLSKTPYLWRKLDHKHFKGKEVYFQRVQKHFVFFKKLPSGDLGILSVLHERMNLPARLLDDAQLDETP